MIQVHIMPTKEEYSKYLMGDNRFICKKMKITNKGVTFYEIWGIAGWQKTINMEEGYFEVEVKRIRE